MTNVDLSSWPFLKSYTHLIQRPTREIVGREEVMQDIQAQLCRPELCNVMLIAEAGAGKALSNKTLIPVPTNELYKPIGNIKIGDMVYDERGYPTKVIGVYPQGPKKAFKLTFEDDSIIVCNDEHIWNVRHVHEDGFKNMTLREMMKRDTRDGVYFVKNNGPVEKPIVTLPQDAYQAGYSFGSNSAKPVERVYFTAHLMQRKSFIHGVMDSCGILEIDGATAFYNFHFDSECARTSFDNLCNSVGLRTVYSSSCSGYGLRLLNIADLMDYVPLKNLDMNIIGRNVNVTRTTSQLKLVHIEELFREEPMTCIYVDAPSHLFQAGMCHIVTHNTAVVQGLMMRDENRQYLEIDLAKMIADLNDPNEMASRLKQLMDEAQQYKDMMNQELVLFIDEFHQIVQLSAAAVEALKPILADSGVRGIRIIAATTTEEFIQWLRPNQALQERLQKIFLPVVDETTTVNILRGMAETYGVSEQFYNDYMFHKIYEYTNRYIPASVQPRKSILILDAMIGWHRAFDRKLDEDLLADVIQKSSNVKVNFKVDAVNIKKTLDANVLAQGYATTMLQKKLQVCSAGLNNPNRPMGTFLFTGSTGVGKDLWDEVPIPVYDPSGETVLKRNGDLMVGDYVFNKDGKPVKITGVFHQGIKELYEVTLTDGRIIHTGEGHLWTYKNIGGRGSAYWRVASTKELMKKLNSTRVKFVIPMNGAVEYIKRDYQMMAPYEMGSSLDINSEHIPVEYLYGSVEQRWDFVRGLFDAHGSIGPPERMQLSYSAKTLTLAKDIASLLYSLGISCKCRQQGYRHVVEVKCCAVDKLRFFKSEYKLNVIAKAVEYENNKKNKRHFDVIGIKSIKRLHKKAPTTCIMVDDEEHLYQAGDYIVTHNTEMTKQLAKLLFDDERALIRFDMTEYANADSMERFRKELTDRVWARPYSIVLLDEIEKASGAVTRILLPVIDDGRLIDSNNREVAFTNTYLIFTTNAGSEIYRNISQYNVNDEGSAEIVAKYNKLIRRSLSETTGDNKFPPELLGRIGDDIIPFQPLSEETQRRIVEMKLHALMDRVLQLHGVQVGIDRKVIQYLVEDTLDTQSDSGGARAVISKLESEVTAAISEFIIAHPLNRKIGVKVEGKMMSDNKNQLESSAFIKVVPLKSMNTRL